MDGTNSIQLYIKAIKSQSCVFQLFPFVSDACHTLVCAIILLNDDIHNSPLAAKVSKLV